MQDSLPYAKNTAMKKAFHFDRQEPCMNLGNRGFRLKPLAEVERALLVVKVLKSPQPKLGSLLVLCGAEHFCP